MEILIYRGYEYADAEAAAAVFERANEMLEDCSLFRTATQDMSRWFVLGVFEPRSKFETFDWGDGVEFTPAPEQIEWMADRRHERAMRAFLRGDGHVSEVNRYTPEDDVRIPAKR